MIQGPLWQGGLVDTDVEAYLDAISSPARRRDAEDLINLMRRVTGQEPRMWGTIVGFGSYHYKYDSGREGDTPAAGFAARKSATTVYLLDGVVAHPDLLERLGPHKTGVGCLYIRRLEDVDLDTLESVVGRSYTALTGGTHTKRAGEGGS